MKLYLIHAPLGLESVAAAELARADAAGFSWPALLFGPFWLLAKRQWIALAGYVVCAVAAIALGRSGFLAPVVTPLLFTLGHLWLGFQGRALAAAARERRGLALADVIFAGSALEAEKIYVERKLRPLAPRRAGPLAPGASGDVIGLFPEPGR